MGSLKLYAGCIHPTVTAFPPASGNDYQKDKQFCKLNAVKDNIKVKMLNPK